MKLFTFFIGKIMESKIIKIHLPILFHFYREHKECITELRIWLIARYILDTNGSGKASFDELKKISNLSSDYLLRICKKTGFFWGIKKEIVYYKSANRIAKKHRINIKRKIRGDKFTKKFIKQFISKKKFLGFITKAYFEIDLDKKFKNKITKGRIGYQNTANHFNISKLTAITNIKNSNAKVFKNIKEFKNIRFKTKNEFGNWLLNNMESEINGYIISKNPNSYRIKFDPKGYYLTQQLPNIYKFTGVFLVNTRRGAMPSNLIKKAKACVHRKYTNSLSGKTLTHY